MRRRRRAAGESTRNRWDLTGEERDRLDLRAERGYGMRDFVLMAARSPQIIPEALTAMAHGAKDAAINNGSLVWVLDSQRARQTAPGIASGAHWIGERWFSEALLPLLRPDMLALDLGCGAGRISRRVGPLVDRLVCADPSTTLLKEAQRNLVDVPGVRFVKTDGLTLAGVESASVDLVLSQGVLSYLDLTANAILLEEVKRVLRPGGTSVVNCFTIDGGAGARHAQAAVRHAASRGRWSGSAGRPYASEQLRSLHALAGLELDEVRQASEADDATIFFAHRPPVVQDAVAVGPQPG